MVFGFRKFPSFFFVPSENLTLLILRRERGGFFIDKRDEYAYAKGHVYDL